jgi:phosphate transport system substrate-binding protein
MSFHLKQWARVISGFMLAMIMSCSQTDPIAETPRATEQPAAGSETVIKVDEQIAPYKKASGVSGNLSSIGSDTMNNLITYWAEGFCALYPSVNRQIEGKGSATAPPALEQGTSNLGPMSRPMKDDEIAKIEAKYGVKPLGISVALDALEVYVNKDNPIQNLTIPQLDAIFSKTRKQNYPEDITTWGQLGLTGDWANKPISLYGRNSASGTYGFFKEHVLGKGDFKDSVKEQPGSASVVQGVSGELGAIGYSGAGYSTSGVKGLMIAAKEGAEAFAPKYENVLNKKYPLSRPLIIYVIKPKDKPLDPIVSEFLKFALSREGQQIVIKDGYMPLPAKMVQAQLAKLK